MGEQEAQPKAKHRRGTGSVYQQKNSRFWWIQYFRGGKVYRESTRTVDRRKAERMLARRLGEIATNNFIGPRVEKTLVDELAADFLTDYETHGRKSVAAARLRWRLHLQPIFGHCRAVDVSTAQIRNYIADRQHAGASNATINRELAALKRMFVLGAQSTPPKVYQVPTFPDKLDEKKAIRRGFVEDSQYERIKHEAAKRGLWMRAIIEVAYTYGWRIGELKRLRVEQVNLESQTIRLDAGETQNNEAREVEMTDDVFVLLQSCVAGKKPTDLVFTREHGQPIKDFRKTWAKVTDAAGVPGLLVHDMRRSAARNLRRAGVAEGVIMDIGGWKTRSVFERYAIVNNKDRRDAVLKLANQRKANELQRAENRSNTARVEPKPVQSSEFEVPLKMQRVQ